jgi:PAS domain S-box-containing protein
MTPRPSGARAVLRRPGAAPIAVAVMAALVLSAVGWAAVRHGRATVLDQATDQVRSSADATVRALQSQASDLVRAASTTATQPAVQAGLAAPGAGTHAALQAQLSALARADDSPAAFVTDLRGRVVAVYPAQPELVGADFSFRDWFKGVSATGQPYLSDAYRSAANGQPLVVAVAVPVQVAARRVGYLTVLWPLESVGALAEGSERDDGVGITITDQRGVPLTAPLAVDERGQARLPTLSGPTRDALAGRSSSAVRDGQVVVARPVPGLGWTVTAGQPTSVALAPARGLRDDLVLALALAFAVVLALTLPAVGRARRVAAAQAVTDDEHRRLTALFAASPVGILETLPDGTVLAANAAMVEMLGYPVDQLLTMSAHDLAHPDENPAVPSGLDGVVDGRTSTWTGARLYRARDGSPVPAHVSVVALRDDSGRIRQLVGFLVDQRKQQAAADALGVLTSKVAEREAFLKTLFDTIDVSVLACDADGRLTLVNHLARHLSGLDEDAAPEELGERMDLRHPDGRPMPVPETPLARALTEGEVRNAQVVVPARMGRPAVHLLAHAHRLTGPHGEVLGAVVAAHDVTAVQQAEAALKASENRFRRVFDEGLTGKLLVGEDGRVVRVNGTFSRLIGRSTAELVGTPLVDSFADPDDRQRVSELLAAKEGELRAEMALPSAQGEPLWGSVALV